MYRGIGVPGYRSVLLQYTTQTQYRYMYVVHTDTTEDYRL